MQITVKFKLLPAKEQTNLIQSTTTSYIHTVNQIVSYFVAADRNLKYSSKDIDANLPSAVKNQAIQDAVSIFAKYKKNIYANAKLKSEQQKEVKIPRLKKPVAIWNNQNYALKEDLLAFPVFIGEKSKRIEVKALLTAYQRNRLMGKLGSLRITRKSGKYIAQIAVDITRNEVDTDKIMGVDLGLKIPAVAVIDNGKTRFFGNGRQNKFIKRKHRSTRKKLGRQKKPNAIKNRRDKEQRWMKDQDHKISRRIVNFAEQHEVAVIRLEQLSGIRQTARTSRKNEKNLHNWSFYRLAKYIEYKAHINGMTVEYVNPKHTSRKCPACGRINKAKDRKYICGCGFKTHRDRLGAINIISATVADGNSLPA